MGEETGYRCWCPRGGTVHDDTGLHGLEVGLAVICANTILLPSAGSLFS